MNSRGQMYKRTPQEIRAEERKIRNRESASIRYNLESPEKNFSEKYGVNQNF